MFTSYFTIAIRNLIKHRLYSVINIVGLVIGLTALLMTRTIIDYEESHDSFFTNSERIFAIYGSFQPNAGIGIKSSNGVQSAIQPLLASSVPGITFSARLMNEEFVARAGDKLFDQPIRFADPDFLDIFKLDFIEGNPETALAQPENVILSESAVLRYFGESDPIGQVITLDNRYDLRVTAVIRDLPVNSHFTTSLAADPVFEFLTTMDAYSEVAGFDTAGGWNSMNDDELTYVLLAEGTSEDEVNAELAQFYQDHVPDEVKELVQSFGLRPLTDLNLFIWTATGLPVPTSIRVIGILILLVAIINYTNLANAQYMGRTREIGLRKSLGAGRQQLIGQFLTESIAISLMALVIAIGVSEMILPVMSDATGKLYSLGLADSPFAGIMLFFISVGTGLLGGLYPALKISKTPAATCLAEGSGAGGSKSRIRNIIVAFQFAVAIVLAAGSGVIYAQNQYMESNSNQFDRDHIVTLDRIGRKEVLEQFDSLKGELLRIPGVESVTVSNNVPFEQSSGSNNYTLIRGDETAKVQLNLLWVEHDFFNTYEIPILAGRDFLVSNPADTYLEAVAGEDRQPTVNIILNQTAIRLLGWNTPEEALGQSFFYSDPDTPGMAHRIVGIVPDINYRGFHNEAAPTMFVVRKAGWQTAAVKISGVGVSETLSRIDAAWARVNPDYPITRSFLRGYFNEIFNIMRGMSITLSVFSIIAVFVALIGLFGLAAFMAERRTREIGIRKALGASITDLMKLLVYQISKPVLVAILVAAPLAYFVTGQYLNFFAERISVAPFTFVLAAFVVLGMAWFIVSIHAFRVARASPILALRYE